MAVETSCPLLIPQDCPWCLWESEVYLAGLLLVFRSSGAGVMMAAIVIPLIHGKSLGPSRP